MNDNLTLGEKMNMSRNVTLTIGTRYLTETFAEMEKRMEIHSPDVAAILGWSGSVEEQIEATKEELAKIKQEVFDDFAVVEQFPWGEIFRLGEFTLGGMKLPAYGCTVVGFISLFENDFTLLCANGDTIAIVEDWDN